MELDLYDAPPVLTQVAGMKVWWRLDAADSWNAVDIDENM